jgi:uncharacterized membrane protein HdeD (DUF308 family)
MMCPGALPVGQLTALLVLGPPVMTFFWFLMSRGWGRLVQGGTLSDRTRKRQRWEFWILLSTMYAIGLGLAIYASSGLSQNVTVG